jgi:hypothetical protein
MKNKKEFLITGYEVIDAAKRGDNFSSILKLAVEDIIYHINKKIKEKVEKSK